jgi:ABC-type phosphate/phosphonate transport system substrate-binding protein
MISSLPMYLRAETRPAHDGLWALIRDALRDHGVLAPEALSHDAPIRATWARTDLILGQICNLPYNLHARQTTHRIGTCDYGLPGAPSGHYYSLFVVRADDPRPTPAAFATARLAINEADSHSGWGAPWGYARDNNFAWQHVVETGAHAHSAAAIARGEADIAAIDAVSWRLIQRYDACAQSLRVIGRTATSPGQTLITHRQNDPAPIRTAVAQALTALPQSHAQTLMLRAIVALPDTDYDGVARPILPPLQETATKTG